MSADDAIVTACWTALKDYGSYVDPDAFRAALSAAGWVVVPKRLTNEMFNAGVVQKNKGNPIPNIWAAMIAAAPEMAAALSDLIEVVDYIERTYGSRINPPTLDNARALLARIRGDAT